MEHSHFISYWGAIGHHYFMKTLRTLETGVSSRLGG